MKCSVAIVVLFYYQFSRMVEEKFSGVKESF
jgi:hypothetical protein